ncbi:Pycsar system effector family protein [Streptomyces sp. NPDC051016]|uniref:Pycsar system effector family protein n=1 Tax=Streptomyces sp. NPDC051016 TaxID=3365638 RepID=UPI0037967847
MTTAPDAVLGTTSCTPDQALDDAVRDTDAKITRTDSKASLLLAFVGAVLAGLGSTVDDHLPFVTMVFGAGAVLALAVAAVLLLLVVRPRLGGADRASFPYWARLVDDTEVLASMTGDTRAARIRVMSRIAVRKFTLLAHAVDLILGALLLLAIAAAGLAL